MTHANRRRFLKATVAASGSVLMPVSSVRAQVQGAKVQGANDVMGVAIIGAGTRGKNHLAGWLGDPRSDVVMVVDADESRAAALCDAAEKEQGFRPRMVQDMRRAFDSKDV